MRPLNRPYAPPKVLIVDDDEIIRAACALTLDGAGYRTALARDGLDCLSAVARERPELVLLDVDMPFADGWEVLARLRQQPDCPPVIMLTGSIGVESRVRGLNAGADDYICKPCDFRELLARVNGVLRRREAALPAKPVLHFGPTTVDLAERTATRAGRAVKLTRTEFALLEIFAREPGSLVTREQMLGEVWGYTAQAHTRTVDTHIWRLRQKLGEKRGAPRWIRTEAAGDGYRMVCDPAAA